MIVTEQMMTETRGVDLEAAMNRVAAASLIRRDEIGEMTVFTCIDRTGQFIVVQGSLGGTAVMVDLRQ